MGTQEMDRGDVRYGGTPSPGRVRDTLNLELPAVKRSVPQARHEVAAFAERLDVDQERLKIAVTEAVTNAILHGYRDGRPGTVRVHAQLSGNDLVVEVSDDGVGMRPNPDSPGMGMGLPLISSMAQSVEIDNDGDGVTVRMLFPADAHAGRLN